MSNVPSTSREANLRSGAGDSSTRSTMVPQQVGHSVGREASLGQDQAGAGSRPSHTLLPREQKERAGSRSVVHYLRHRSVGAPGRLSLQGLESQMHSSVISRLPQLMTERRLGLGPVDKVFASQWLSESQVVCGTRCNTLFVLDVKTGHVTSIPLMQDRRRNRWARAQLASCIRAIELNPSKTLLATGGENSNSLGVYQLPSLDPLCLGDCRGHKAGITSIAWVSDTVAMSGSWDGTMALWKVDPDMLSSRSAGHSEQSLPVYAHLSPRDREVFPAASPDSGNGKVRALAFNRKRQELGAVTLDGYFHLWKAQSSLIRLHSFRMPFDRDNTCLTYCDEFSLYAAGFRSQLSLLDLRQRRHSIGVRPLCYLHCGIDVRSMSVHEHIITVGTGCGSLFFFDIRERMFLEERSLVNPESGPQPTGRELRLICSEGWVNQDDLRMNHFLGIEQVPYAVYTHCYNWPEMKLFVGGGPVSSQVRGNYAGLWS